MVLEIQKIRNNSNLNLASNRSIEDCRTSFTVTFNRPWTSRVGVSKVSKKFQI